MLSTCSAESPFGPVGAHPNPGGPMRSRNAIWRITLAAALIGAVAAPAAAQPGKDKKEEKKEEKAEKKADKAEEKADKKDEKADKKDEKADEKADKKDANAEERQAKRQERRKERRAKIKEKWGDLVKRPEVQNELKKHARRLARLNRLLALAVEAKKDDKKKKIEELIEKENKRHETRMAQLKTKGDQK
jgi:hypothetical protein